MIKKETLKSVLKALNFTLNKNEAYKKFTDFDCELRVDFKNSKLIYPEAHGLIINERQTCNFSDNENFVVFECVHRLMAQGYNPKHIELEPKWQVGHGASGGRADILVKDSDEKSLLIIECKTAGAELNKAWSATQTKPTQIFSYARQETSTQFIALYASDYIDEQLTNNYYLINLNDNKQLLKDDEKLKPYTSATTVEELYEVWTETYKKDYATIGLFEKNRAYEIGKSKYSLDDLKDINSKDIQGKYHAFSTILRQHNVSGRENAFDKLVSLFLCKVVDEKLNPNELKFYYKGRAYDSPYELQDRLQQLYKEGMERFLGEDITYIDNQAIDNAFRVFKDKPNATKDVIKDYFKQLKFFTNNDFAFIDVHNEKLFHQNFDVLLKILKLFQDIKLTGGEENQFLGDMFEGFLDQGVKQSEGQFFTPMPIVKFIVNSLPKKEKAKVIDYACGAGHFLNEYASVNQNCDIIGIEKEYRLSKVAKVNSFMYNQEIDIIYSDALSPHKKLITNSFDTLIANPPYSVKGFLETLTKQQRENFKLINAIDEKSYTANNAIECFFMERAIQLLKSGGDAGIIVPSSILSKGSHKINAKSKNIYVQTRELILQYFHIVAIAEFGSGTFGKTGTNTVTLFLKRREQNPDSAEHFKNMVDTWFSGDFSTNQAFQDEQVLESYLNHVSLKMTDYQTFLKGKINNALQKTDIFQDYLNDFIALSETKNRKKKKTYQQKTKEQQQEIETSIFLTYTKAIEKDKCYYFFLAFNNGNEVIIIKSPSDNKQNKKFLGYDWSTKKGGEGIKYIASQATEVENSGLEEDEQRTLENLQNLDSINTPLYNPKDRLDDSKINTLIAKNFVGERIGIPQELSEFVTKSKLVDMLDFSGVGFNKAIHLSLKKNINLKSKWDMVTLSKEIDIIGGGTPNTNNPKYWNGSIPWLSIADFNNKNRFVETAEKKITEEGLQNSSTKFLNVGDIIISARGTIGAMAQLTIPMTFNQSCYGLRGKKRLNNGYLYYVLKLQIDQLKDASYGSTFGSITTRTFSEIKIPLPPMDIQEKIVNACGVVDSEVQKQKESIKQLLSDIEKEISGVDGEMTKLQDITSKIGSGSTPRGGESSYKVSGINLIRSQNIYDNGFHVKGLAYIDEEQALKLDNVTVKENDVLFNITGASVARCCVVDLEFLPARVNQHVAIIRATERATPKFLQLVLTSAQYKTDLIEIASKSSTREAITKTQLENYKVPLPNLTTQQSIIERVEKLKTKITQAQTTIDNALNKKEAILKSFL